jgi:hypothetical protein
MTRFVNPAAGQECFRAACTDAISMRWKISRGALTAAEEVLQRLIREQRHEPKNEFDFDVNEWPTIARR